MLKSRGVLTADDEEAFSFSQNLNAPSNAALFDEANSDYLSVANSLEIQTELELLPESPEEWFHPPA
jgi:hypothetical protein